MHVQKAALVALFLAISVGSLSAQMRGSHFAMRGPSVSFGGRAGFGGGARFAQRGFAGRGFVGHNFAGRRSFVPVRRFHSRRLFTGPIIYGYPYYGYPYYDTLGYGYSSYDSSYDTAAYNQSQQQVSQQLYDLSSEVRDLRDQNDQLRYDLERRRYRGDDPPQSTPRPQPQSSLQSAPEGPAAVFVFKDGVRLDAHNYAIVGQTLWILSPQRAMKYPVAQLDYDATRKANVDRGIDMTLPAPVSAPAKPRTDSPSALRGD